MNVLRWPFVNGEYGRAGQKRFVNREFSVTVAYKYNISARVCNAWLCMRARVSVHVHLPEYPNPRNAIT